MKIALLFTCYNRIEKTRDCVESINKAIECANNSLRKQGEGLIEEEWYITDAGSDDGTVDILKHMIKQENLHLKIASNDTFYSQGMRIAMEELKKSYKDEDNFPDYVFLINDDVSFYEEFICKLLDSIRILQEEDCTTNKAIIVGATDNGVEQTYGGVKYRKPVRRRLFPQTIHYDMVSVSAEDKTCDTFNANCVVIPGDIFLREDIMDNNYVHGLGDFDYGLSFRKKGYSIVTSDYYVGKCSNNSREGSWMDRSLTRKDRIKELNSFKGSPTKQWFYFLNKNFGFTTAVIYSVSPYIRILIKK